MELKSQNLVIVLTDIVGFTEATAAQSRAETDRLLRIHNQTLLPFVEALGGRHIKSIGDSLLLTFNSSTDALLCAMAMQDALYTYNRTAPDKGQIHIRIAVNIGEVQLAPEDVLGDPVNVASRIEKMTPVDEIYFSEAVYMTMNKAEIPAAEVGLLEFKGVAQKVRVYAVPRFSTQKLAVENVYGQDNIGNITYPYGGVHLRVPARPVKIKLRSRKVLWGAVAVVLLLVVTASLQHRQRRSMSRQSFMEHEPAPTITALRVPLQPGVTPLPLVQERLPLPNRDLPWRKRLRERMLSEPPPPGPRGGVPSPRRPGRGVNNQLRP